MPFQIIKNYLPLSHYFNRVSRHFGLFLLLNVVVQAAFAQSNVIELSLDEVIRLAQENAPEVQTAKATLQRNRLTYNDRLLDLKPSLNLTAQLPVYNRVIYPVTQPDGTQRFQRNQSLSSNFDLEISKPIAATGGRVYASSGLRQRLDFLPKTSGGNIMSYFSSPIFIGLTQPIFGFNAFKWDKKILPLVLEEAEREYAEQLADVAQQAVSFFFDLYIAQLNLESAKRDKVNAKDLYQLAQNRYSVGKIAEADVLQMELGVMQAETRQARAELNIQGSVDNLRYFLGMGVVDKIVLVVPEGVPLYVIDRQLALQQAAANRKYTFTQNRQRIEAERDIERVEKESGIDISVQAGFGLTKSDETLLGAYGFPLQDQEQVSLSISVPIMDWGRAESKRQLAANDRQLLEFNIEQENINFERNVLLKIRQFDIIRSQLAIAKRSNEVAAKRYDITQKRYTVGKVDVTELNVALNEQISARQNFTQALRDFWAAHYEIQRLTLFDFEKGQKL